MTDRGSPVEEREREMIYGQKVGDEQEHEEDEDEEQDQAGVF